MGNADQFKAMSKGLDLAQAIFEADRCLLCHDAPCSEACPANTQPAEFIRKLRFKNITGAIRTIKENNILGGACGVLCPTSRLCEEKCSAMFQSQNRPEGADRPIPIGKIQRFLIEHAWDRGFKVFEKAPPRSQKVAVVGSGPGGLSCAAELAKGGYRVTVFEAGPWELSLSAFHPSRERPVPKSCSRKVLMRFFWLRACGRPPASIRQATTSMVCSHRWTIWRPCATGASRRWNANSRARRWRLSAADRWPWTASSLPSGWAPGMST